MNTISTSIRKITNLFVILFVLLSGGLVYWQVVAAQQVAANPHNIRHCLPDSAPIRGRILDRNGVVLAYSRKVDPNAPNAGIVCGYQRVYTDPSLAGLIGYYISPLFSSIGIEHEFDSYLNGHNGLTGLDNTINQALHRPPVGDDIYLTIDIRIQRIVNHLFDADAQPPDYHFVFPTDRGSVIVSDPHTGEILAMLSRPGFDPNRVAAGDLNYFHRLEIDPEQPLLERPIQASYVPGSTYKTMTLLAGLDSGSASLDDQFDQQHALGPVYFNGQKFGPVGNNLCCYTYHYPVNLRYGYAHSDNIIFAQEGVKMGARTWLDYNERFYVGKQIPFDLPVVVSSVTKNGQPLATNELAANSFGQGFDAITPLQESLIDNAIANDGQLMRPMLVMKIVQPKNVDPNQTGVPAPIPIDPNQTEGASYSPQLLATPISSQTASLVRDAMYGVARCGSTSYIPKLFDSPWSIIAKTGTGEVGGNKNPQAWLLTQAPYHNPQLTIVAMKENGGEASFDNGPMVADMYNDILANVLKLPLPPPPDPQNPYCYQTTGLLQTP